MEFHTIISVKPKENYIIEATFKNGVIKEYDMKVLIQKFKVFKDLEKIELFNKVKVDIGGYGIVWNEDIDLSGEEIWKNGK